MKNINLRVEREKLKISQMKLAYLAKVSRFRIACHEQGYHDLKELEWQRINKTLKNQRDIIGDE
jgi:predicted transcriptional regulator